MTVCNGANGRSFIGLSDCRPVELCKQTATCDTFPVAYVSLPLSVSGHDNGVPVTPLQPIEGALPDLIRDARRCGRGKSCHVELISQHVDRLTGVLAYPVENEMATRGAAIRIP